MTVLRLVYCLIAILVATALLLLMGVATTAAVVWIGGYAFDVARRAW